MWSPVVSPSNILDNNGPKKRCKHAVCLHMENIYMYGGKQGHRALKDFWKYDVINKIWEKIDSDGEHPPALQQHTVVPNGDKIYVFGGELCVSAETPLWVYDIPQQSWYKCKSKSQSYSVKYKEYKNSVENNNKINNNESPSGRRGHSAVLIHPDTCGATGNLDNGRSKMIVFGGFKEAHGSTEELYCFDIATETWHLLSPKQKVPPARHSHSAVVYNGYMWIYGGMTNLKERNDFWKYNIASNQWEPINSWQGPGYLHSHTAVVLHDNMIIFGGETQGTLSNDIWKFTFQNGLWEKISCDIKPSPCSQLAAIVVPSSQVVGKTVPNVVNDKDIKFRNSAHTQCGDSCGLSHDNEYDNDSVSEYNQHKIILSKPCDIPQIVQTFNKSLTPSNLNGSMKKIEISKKSYIPDDELILVNEMHNSPVDDPLCDIIDGEIEILNSDHDSRYQTGKISTCNEYFLDITLQKNCKNDYFSLIDYSDHNEYENKTNWYGLQKNSYNEKINESFICDESTFEMQDFSNNNILNNSYKEDTKSIDLDTMFASKTITLCHVENQYKYNKQQQCDYENNRSPSRDLMYIFCGKEGNQSSQITESLTIWEFDLH